MTVSFLSRCLWRRRAYWYLYWSYFHSVNVSNCQIHEIPVSFVHIYLAHELLCMDASETNGRSNSYIKVMNRVLRFTGNKGSSSSGPYCIWRWTGVCANMIIRDEKSESSWSENLVDCFLACSFISSEIKSTLLATTPCIEIKPQYYDRSRLEMHLPHTFSSFNRFSKAVTNPTNTLRQVWLTVVYK